MKKDMIFFGEKGITSTSANTVANLAKESIQTLETELCNLEFYTIQVGLIGSSDTNIIQKAIDTDTLDSIPASLEKLAKIKSLIAWLREAIKARESLRKELNKTTIQKFCENNDIEYPETPEYADILTEDEYYGSLNIKTRNRYYYLETICSNIGKYIHPTGHYSEARKSLKNVLSHPYKIEGNGRDTIIYENKVDNSILTKVEDVFFTLQDKHREAQKQLNAIKYECEKAIQESEAKADAEYKTAMAEYNAKIKEINALYREWTNKESAKISQLKIVIPESLQSIYEEISKLGK